MTVVVFRDGVLATDSAVWQGSVKCDFVKKIHVLYDGSVFAASGASDEIEAAVEWLDNNGPRPEKSDPDCRFSGLLIARDGVTVRGISDRFQIFETGSASWQVVGACTEFLHGALAAGATAEEAVRLAIEHTDGAGGDVQVYRFGEAP